jgi:hypothetical protein
MLPYQCHTCNHRFGSLAAWRDHACGLDDIVTTHGSDNDLPLFQLAWYHQDSEQQGLLAPCDDLALLLACAESWTKLNTLGMVYRVAEVGEDAYPDVAHDVLAYLRQAVP